MRSGTEKLRCQPGELGAIGDHRFETSFEAERAVLQNKMATLRGSNSDLM